MLLNHRNYCSISVPVQRYHGPRAVAASEGWEKKPSHLQSDEPGLDPYHWYHKFFTYPHPNRSFSRLLVLTGLFRTLNPVFVFVFTLLTRYVFKVAVSEEEGGRRLAFMIADPSLDTVTGGYFSGKPGKPEFIPYPVSREAGDLDKAKRFWEYSRLAVENQISNKKR